MSWWSWTLVRKYGKYLINRTKIFCPHRFSFFIFLCSLSSSSFSSKGLWHTVTKVNGLPEPITSSPSTSCNQSGTEWSGRGQLCMSVQHSGSCYWKVIPKVLFSPTSIDAYVLSTRIQKVQPERTKLGVWWKLQCDRTKCCGTHCPVLNCSSETFTFIFLL